jgi:hypothetical protein
MGATDPKGEGEKKKPAAAQIREDLTKEVDSLSTALAMIDRYCPATSSTARATLEGAKRAIELAIETVYYHDDIPF